MITIRGLEAGYGARTVLRGVDLDVVPGELVAVCGPNGCGKTTLLRVLTGVVAATAGSVLIAGRPVAATPAAALARTVGVVAQNAAVPPGFTAFEITMMGRTPHLRLLQSEGRRDVEIVRRAMMRTDTWA
ncbi:MAG TPA: ABC transporter ATP-binding protein, partial [Dehalococcoidia bacterium]|nr:ABC transporter ATP-binding protein [Dehalococcoidia bacterium]